MRLGSALAALDTHARDSKVVIAVLPQIRRFRFRADREPDIGEQQSDGRRPLGIAL